MPYSSPSAVTTGTTITSTWGNSVKSAADYLANPPACRVYHSAAQAIATGTNTPLAFNSERYDTDSMHDTVTNNTRITFNTAGLYVVGGNVEFEPALGSYMQIGIRLNAANSIAWALITPTNVINKLNVSAVYKFAVGDRIELMVEHSHGSNRNVTRVDGYSPEFWATWIGLG